VRDEDASQYYCRVDIAARQRLRHAVKAVSGVSTAWAKLCDNKVVRQKTSTGLWKSCCWQQKLTSQCGRHYKPPPPAAVRITGDRLATDKWTVAPSCQAPTLRHSLINSQAAKFSGDSKAADSYQLQNKHTNW